MNITQLENFIVVAEFGNMTRAADYLYVTQPTLSRQISDLEEEIGCPLFIRGKQNLTLTEEGRKCVEESKAILLRWEQLKTDIENHKKTGSIRIGHSGLYLNTEISETIYAFEQRYPDISITTECKDIFTLGSALKEDEFDAVITVMPTLYNISGLTEVELDNTNVLSVAVSKHNPLSKQSSISMEMLSGQHLYFQKGQSFSMRYPNELLKISKSHEFVPDIETMMIYIGADKGVGFIGSSFQTRKIDNVVLIPFEDYKMKPVLVMAYKEDNHKIGLDIFSGFLRDRIETNRHNIK